MNKTCQFGPEDGLAPNAPKFAEAWHAQVLAIADTMITNGRVSANLWAETLGAELRKGEAEGAPDTETSYYEAALRALEHVLASGALVSTNDLTQRRNDWETAYLETRHGQPVILK
ncbi:SH3-like domain-containing protein [Cochlodiniinecator piscidefendens]|uniref:SH3-like domain-containing protein n=1 Tax=Cochlodiniinecator piscidefendens TaxID=2715756 RepID=UPI00140A14B2|nr:SH3-like domain-containing protein [Cochlodiniinecator piscidefendens]